MVLLYCRITELTFTCEALLCLMQFPYAINITTIVSEWRHSRNLTYAKEITHLGILFVAHTQWLLSTMLYIISVVNHHLLIQIYLTHRWSRLPERIVRVDGMYMIEYIWWDRNCAYVQTISFSSIRDICYRIRKGTVQIIGLHQIYIGGFVKHYKYVLKISSCQYNIYWLICN